MNARDKMQEQIRTHGEQLKAIFGLAPDVDADKLARKVHQIEGIAHRYAEDLCNGIIEPTEDEQDESMAYTLRRLDKVLGYTKAGVPVEYNLDARGYALKISSEYVRAQKLDIHQDMGGYGILAPEFDGRN